MSDVNFSSWANERPTHWGLMRLGHLAKIYAGGTPDKGTPEYWGGNIPWLNSGTVNQWLITEASEYITDAGFQNSSARWIPKGALLMALAGQGKTKGMTAQLDFDATCNQSIAAIIPSSGNNRFLLYWLSANYRNIRGMASDDLRDGLNLVMLGQIPVPVPPGNEQEVIANYLDAETVRIDDLIREKDELIELLKEWRQSAVDEVLFRGLNPECASKKSGITWVKNIPAHWNISRLRFLVKLNPSFSKELDGDMNVSFLPMEAIGADGNLNLEYSRKVNEVSSGYTYFEDGDVTIAKITPCFENGKGAVMHDLKHGVGFGTTELIVMRPDSEINSRWLYYLTMSNAFRFPGEAMMLGAGGQKRVPDLFVKDYRAPVPPKSEQKEIADYLDIETAKIDKLITHTTDEIALLKELRAATIADAVLGRIDVRTKQ